jgi:hypothetical protein
MDKYDDISIDENILILNVPDDVLERAPPLLTVQRGP